MASVISSDLSEALPISELQVPYKAVLAVAGLGLYGRYYLLMKNYSLTLRSSGSNILSSRRYSLIKAASSDSPSTPAKSK